MMSMIVSTRNETSPPCKGIQDILGLWMPGIGFRIPVVSGIPEFLELYSGFHLQKFSGLGNLDFPTWGDYCGNWFNYWNIYRNRWVTNECISIEYSRTALSILWHSKSPWILVIFFTFINGRITRAFLSFYMSFWLARVIQTRLKTVPFNAKIVFFWGGGETQNSSKNFLI